MRIAICDDEKFALDMIAGALDGQLSGLGVASTIDKYNNPLSFKTVLNEISYDCVFLDIEMPDMDGIKLAQYVNEVSHKASRVVFVSNRIDKVFEAFEAQPFAFVRKTMLIDDLFSCVERLINSMNEEKDEHSILIKRSGGFLRVEMEEIIYVEGNKNTQILKMRDGEGIETYTRMKELEDTLTPHGFYRVQRSFLVNMKYIKKINWESITLANGEEITIKRGIYSELKNVFLDYLQKNNIFIKNK